MTTLQQTIASLDDMRGKATQGEWDWRHGDNGIDLTEVGEGIKFATFFKEKRIQNAEYVIALHNTLPTLRNAALEAERYKRAGEKFVQAVLEASRYNEQDSISAALHQAGVNYRRAVEQKEV